MPMNNLLFADFGITLPLISCSMRVNTTKTGNTDSLALEIKKSNKETDSNSQESKFNREHIFFSFGKADPRESNQKIDYLKFQIQKVKSAIESLQQLEKSFKQVVSEDETTQNIACVKKELQE